MAAVPFTVTELEGQRCAWIGGDNAQHVAGESYQQDHLGRVASAFGLHRPIVAWLITEPTNAADPTAVMVWVAGAKVGYIPRAISGRWQPAILEIEREAQARVACPGKLFVSEDGPAWAGTGQVVEFLLQLPPTPPEPPAPPTRPKSGAPTLRVADVAITIECPACRALSSASLGELDATTKRTCSCGQVIECTADELAGLVAELRRIATQTASRARRKGKR